MEVSCDDGRAVEWGLEVGTRSCGGGGDISDDYGQVVGIGRRGGCGGWEGVSAVWW